MSHEQVKDESPLLEIEAIQLSELFRCIDHAPEFSFENCDYTVDLDRESLSSLSDPELYRISKSERDKVFIISAFRTFLDTDPTDEDMSACSEYLYSNQYNRVLDMIYEIRADRIGKIDSNTNQEIELTLGDINRWNTSKRFSLWK
jgi:hypothetical protein